MLGPDAHRLINACFLAYFAHPDRTDYDSLGMTDAEIEEWLSGAVVDEN